MNQSSLISKAGGYASWVKKYALTHKIRAAFILLLVLGGGYWIDQKFFTATTPTKYVLSTVSKGTIIVSISGSGQVSPSNQVDIHPKGSGEITSVRVKNDQKVSAGDVIAYIDSTDAQAALRDAQSSLKSAQLSLQKLTQPADQLTLTQAQHAVDKAQESKTSAQSDLVKAYDNAKTDVISTYLDMPDLMTGYKDVIIGTGSNHNSQWNIDYYRNSVQTYDQNALTYRDDAYQAYQTASTNYNAALTKFQLISPDPSTTEIESSLANASAMLKSTSIGLNAANSFLRFYSDQLTTRNQTPVPTATTALTNLSSYISKTNTHLSSLIADADAIQSAKQAIANADRSIVESQQSLQKIKDGTDTLDVQSSQLSVDQRQNALVTAQNNLANYVIRAPFDGTIANLDLHVGDSVSSGSTVAAEITSQDLAVLSLNEVDAAKVQAGQKATLTFDAIDGLSLTGVVTNINPIGTVSQGVVSYEVQIAFDAQDPRVKAGMTVNASIITDMKQNVVLVPSSAVKTQGGSSYVLVFDTPPAGSGSSTSSSQGVTSDVAPRQQPVETGLTNDTEVEITSGLTEGQTIVTRTITTTTTTAAASTPTLFGAPGGGGNRSGGGTTVRATTGIGR